MINPPRGSTESERAGLGKRHDSVFHRNAIIIPYDFKAIINQREVD